MTLHDRRTFARRLAAFAGAAALPDLLAAFARQEPQRAVLPVQDPQPAQQAPSPSTPRAMLAAAIERARAEGKPLLVFVVPADVLARWTQGSRLGALCNHGEAFVRDLALAVPVCAQVADLRELLPRVSFPGAPLMFALDPDQEGPARAIDAEAQQFALRGVDPTVVEQAIDADIAALTAAAAAVLRPDDQALARLAQRTRARCDDATVQRVDAWLAGGDLPAHADLVRLAAHVQLAAQSLPDERRDAVMAALDASIRAHLVLQRVPGSRWAKALPCGTAVETLPGEQDPPAFALCGMGQVPERSRRFLQFLTKE